ncbi:hypothetical protein T4E_2577 [Trichinella pseudospiralis]|uniref:C2H2-type domain-containing protein n=1 Tax=Trichinella pseudospiralis TaxID=6337 RepID=A0A0V0XQZ4_TRIPS|nr:hypothetical protein T4E_2577 [Trichinella pseudospiralis]
MSSIQRERGHKITKDALNISTSMKCEQWLGQSREIIWCIGERNAVCVAIRRKILDGKKRCNVEGCKERFLSQLQLMEHANTYSGGLKPYMCEEDGSEIMENAYLGSITSIEQLANLKVSQGQAKACCEDMPSSATIVRGTCSGSARSNHECKANRPCKCTWQGAENDSKVKSI